MSTGVLCPTCDPTGRGRYCAPLRCYCGHPDCHAADTYIDIRAKALTAVATPEAKHATAWSDREEPTWIDQL